MKKKLLAAAAAVTGALAVPGIAMADSVTIDGYLKQSIEYLNLGSSAPGRANSSQYQIADGGSRFNVNVSEDLGGGLKAIGLWEVRIAPQNGDLNTGAGAGNMWVGFDNIETWGRVTVGRRDLHYYHTAAGPSQGQSLEDWSTAILSYVQPANAAGKGVNTGVGVGRFNSTVEYTSPKWGLFTFSAAYSMDPNDSATGSMCGGGSCGVATTNTTQKGYAYNVVPQLRGGNWVAGLDYFKAEMPAAAATGPTQKSWRAWGFYEFPQGVGVGADYDQSTLDAEPSGNEIAKRNAWGIPVWYSTGPHKFGAEYTHAGSDDHLSDSGAKFYSIYYQYSLSKRTQIGVSYAELKNDGNASYNLFVGGSTYYDNSSELTQPGEEPKLLSFTINHSF